MQRIVLGCLYLAFASLLALGLWDGFEYYSSPLSERARHEDYWSLKPGGSRGIAYGVLGAGMMTLMLTYSIRKRVSWFKFLGPIRYWLDYHIVLGIFGPLFIVLHSSFKVGGLVSLSFWSMVIVAVSGIFGRFVYLLIPRRRAGDELSLAEVERRNSELSRQVLEQTDLSEIELQEIENLATENVPESLLKLALSLPFEAVRLRRRLGRFVRSNTNLDPRASSIWRKLLWRKLWLKRRVVLWTRLKTLFRYWHVFHKPFAVIMYLSMLVHIGVAWWAGYVHWGA